MKLLILVIFIISLVFSKELYTKSLIAKVQAKYGEFAKNRFLLLKQKILELKDSNEFEKIDGINNFFNKVKYASDLSVWNEKDYWATPFEFLIKDKGDSEDYVFAKYFTLVEELGISEDKFYFSYVKSLQKNVSYMVLLYYENKQSIPIILDAINYKALPATNRADIVPIYSFSPKDLGLNKTKLGNQSNKFKLLIKNIQEEKI